MLGVTAAPLLVNPGADQVALACKAWLADNSERERLIRRWQRLETRLFQVHRWSRLSDDDHDQFAEKNEMDKLDERIGVLHDRNIEVLALLPALSATSSRGTCGKLAGALIAVCPDENEEAHLLIASILRGYPALHGCWRKL